MVETNRKVKGILASVQLKSGESIQSGVHGLGHKMRKNEPVCFPLPYRQKKVRVWINSCKGFMQKELLENPVLMKQGR